MPLVVSHFLHKAWDLPSLLLRGDKLVTSSLQCNSQTDIEEESRGAPAIDVYNRII